MSMNKDNVNGIEMIYPINDLDSVNGEEVKQYVSQVVKEVQGVIIVFSKVNYLNSSGLRELIQTLKIVQDNDKKMILAGMSENIFKIFVNTNLHRLFDIYDKVEDAQKIFE